MVIIHFSVSRSTHRYSKGNFSTLQTHVSTVRREMMGNYTTVSQLPFLTFKYIRYKKAFSVESRAPATP